jgi:hypothetical protein
VSFEKLVIQYNKHSITSMLMSNTFGLNLRPFNLFPGGGGAKKGICDGTER